MLAPWIIEHFPQHRTYVEPFGGAASVLLRKPRSFAEVYNDLDGEVVNLFRVLRNPAQARELMRLITLTPFSREEFEESYITASDPIEQARRTLYRSAAGFSSAGSGEYRTGFRNSTTRKGTTPAGDWQNMPSVLEAVIERLRGVVIENRPAENIIATFDGPDTLFYLDPPYTFGTRNERHAGKVYQHEMTDDDHRRLANALRNVKGSVIISGYACDLYDHELFADWQRTERQTHGESARDRTEVLWLSPNICQQPALLAV